MQQNIKNKKNNFASKTILLMIHIKNYSNLIKKVYLISIIIKKKCEYFVKNKLKMKNLNFL